MNKKTRNTSINLLPHHIQFLKKRRKQFGSLNQYFLYLIHRYGNTLNIMQDHTHRRIFCTYQSTDPNFKIFSFSINKHIWLIMKNLRQSTGFSISFLVAFLITLDLRKTAIRKKVRFFLRFSKNQFTNILTNVRGEIKRTIDLSTNFISTIHLLIGIQIE